MSDLRYTLRSLHRTPLVTATAVLSLGLGIGALTTMWSALDTLVLRPYEYDRDGTLVYVGTVQDGRGAASSPTSVPDFLDLQQHSRTLDVAAYRDTGLNLSGDPAEWLPARRVSHNFFSALGVEPLLGRAFLPDDDLVGSPDVAILGHSLWERRFGADPGVLGRVVRLDGMTVTVVGVLPPGFEFGLDSPELWLPLQPSAADSRDQRILAAVARVRSDYPAARAELADIGAALADAYPETNAGRTYHLSRVQDELFGGARLQQGAAAGIAAALFVLLIACVNVASLLLARGLARENEIALRRALGAGRLRLLRQLLVEAGVLATGAGLVGLLLSIAGLRSLHLILPPWMPRADSLAFDIRAMGIGAAVSAGSIFFFGVLPALRTIRGQAHERRPGAVAGSGRPRGRLRDTLVVVEVTMAVVLLTTTSLVLRSAQNLSAVESGLEPRNAVVFGLNFPDALYPDDDVLRETQRRVQSELRALPGITAVGFGAGAPMRSRRSLSYQLPGMEGVAGTQSLRAFANYWSPEFASAMGIGILQERDIERSDDASSAPVAVVNRSFARAAWQDDEAIGRTLLIGGRTVEVVGVAEDVREFGLQSDAPTAVYLPISQWPAVSTGRSVQMVLRVGPSASSDGGTQASMQLDGLREATHAAVRRVAPDLALVELTTLEGLLGDSTEQVETLAKLLALFAAIAIVLAAIGIYASMAYAVTRRVREIGVRMALGANPSSVRRLVLKRAAFVAGIATVVGLGLAFMAARGMQAFMFGIPGVEPIILAAVPAVLACVTLLAAWVPARRAALVDPMKALRTD